MGRFIYCFSLQSNVFVFSQTSRLNNLQEMDDNNINFILSNDIFLTRGQLDKYYEINNEKEQHLIMNISELQQFTYACKELNKPGFYPLSEKAKQCNNHGHKHFECLDCWKLEKVEGFNMIHLHTKANPVGVIAKFVDKENDQGVFVVD